MECLLVLDDMTGVFALLDTGFLALPVALGVLVRLFSGEDAGERVLLGELLVEDDVPPRCTDFTVGDDDRIKF